MMGYVVCYENDLENWLYIYIYIYIYINLVLRLGWMNWLRVLVCCFAVMVEFVLAELGIKENVWHVSEFGH